MELSLFRGTGAQAEISSHRAQRSHELGRGSHGWRTIQHLPLQQWQAGQNYARLQPLHYQARLRSSSSRLRYAS